MKEGKSLKYIKLFQGFHFGSGQNRMEGWGDWWTQQHRSGIPVNAIGADNAGPLYEIQRNNNERDVLVWRRSLWHGNFDPNSPYYDQKPEDEARRMLDYKYDVLWPDELDKTRVWLKNCNEIRTQTNPGDTWYDDLSAGEWWGRYALEAAKYAIERGYRVILLSPASGDHDEKFWSAGAMIEFLCLAMQNKDNVMIGLHEYSYDADSLFAPHGTAVNVMMNEPENRLIGRFQVLFDVCDKYHLGDWPNVYFCEWGWAERNMPDTTRAMAQILEATQVIYGAYYDYIKGFGTWYLGTNYGDTLPEKANSLLPLCADIAIRDEFVVEPKLPADKVVDKPKIVIVKKPQISEMSLDENQAIGAAAWNDYGRTTTHSHDDMITMLSAGNCQSYAVVWYPEKPSQQMAINLLEKAGYNYVTMSPSSKNFTHSPVRG